MESLLLTGATGFLGREILPVLEQNYKVDTIGRSSSNKIVCDLSKSYDSRGIVLSHPYDVVVHAAGKAHEIPKTNEEKKIFFDVNVGGTKNLCKLLESSNAIPKAMIFISSVAVYGCDYGILIDENHSLDGSTPYAKTKIEAEQYLKQWCNKQFVKLTILRPSLIAGTNPPGNLGAMIKGIKTGKYASICEGKAQKSVCMAYDIAKVIPLAENIGGIYNICDSHNPTFHELELLICKQLGKKPLVNIPYWLANSLAHIGDLMGSHAPINSVKLKKITQPLTFLNKKLIFTLNFTPSDVLGNFTVI
jgi:GlcNAc-P-P-Und epimerase